jgi:folate-dependent phosphoribosylglycinamide formyltransferase PurN
MAENEKFSKNVLFLGSGKYQSIIVENLKIKGCNVFQVDTKILEIDNQIDLVISFGYRYILDQSLLQTSKIPKINLHISYLPWNRGAHPNFWSFWDNTPSGVSIHVIDSGIDTGPILYQKQVIIDPKKETFYSSYQKLNSEIVSLFLENLNSILRCKFIEVPQRGRGSFHYQRNFPKDFSGWESNIESEIARLYRSGFNPNIGKLKLIDDIEKIRNRNNINWMNLLRIVAVEAPDSLTTITTEINEADSEISKLLAKLAEK